MNAAREISLFITQMVKEPWAQRAQNNGMALVCNVLVDAGFVIEFPATWFLSDIGAALAGRKGVVKVRDLAANMSFDLWSELVDTSGPEGAEFGVSHWWRILSESSPEQPNAGSLARTVVAMHLKHVGVSAQQMANFQIGTGMLRRHFKATLEAPEFAVTPAQVTRFVDHFLEGLTP
jgi:hypothetical protein